jgi:amino acid transporter
MLSNSIGFVKTLTLIFIAITGFVVLGGHTKAHTTNFDHSFASTSTTPYGLTNALYKIIFSYQGFENAFNVVNETKNPVKRLRTYGFISIFVVAVLYILANVAYFAAGEK